MGKGFASLAPVEQDSSLEFIDRLVVSLFMCVHWKPRVCPVPTMHLAL